MREKKGVLPEEILHVYASRIMPNNRMLIDISTGFCQVLLDHRLRKENTDWSDFYGVLCR